MRTRNFLALLFLVTSTALSLPGCVIQQSSATANFAWVFDGSAGCDDVGVSRVLVELESFEEGIVFSEVIDCYDGGVTIGDLDAGTYLVYVEGRGSSPYLWSADAEIDLHGGSNEFTVDLRPGRGF